MPARRALILLPALALLAFGLCAVRAGLDRAPGSPLGWTLAWPEAPGLLGLRLMRTASGTVVGVSLAVSGLILQSLLRNPLAAPDLLGVSSCASLCVVAASVFGGVAGAGSAGGLGVLGWQAGPALLGALAGLALVYTLSQRRGWVDTVSMVLVGVIVGVLCGAAVVALQAVYPTAALGAGRILVGALSDDHAPATVAACAGAVGGCLAAAAALARHMDALALGDDEAASVGVPVRAVRLGLFVLAGILAAVGVLLAGPLGFVGLVAPHAARMALGPGHRLLVPAAALVGIALVVGGDVLVRLVDTPGGRLPLGVVMAAVGGPVIVLLVRRQPRVP